MSAQQRLPFLKIQYKTQQNTMELCFEGKSVLICGIFAVKVACREQKLAEFD